MQSITEGKEVAPGFEVGTTADTRLSGNIKRVSGVDSQPCLSHLSSIVSLAHDEKPDSINLLFHRLVGEGDRVQILTDGRVLLNGCEQHEGQMELV
jgi:hypothetical protein